MTLARARSVEKHFGAIAAVRDVTCAFRAGEIHAVCGENGAGKSTLLKIVAGLLVPDAGNVELFGSPLEPHTPREAIRRGAAMVLQHFALIPVFTVLDNLILGAEPVLTGGVLDRASAIARAKALEIELGVKLPLDKRVEDLGVGDRQRLEIARALFREARLVILDEPTAVLTKGEATALYATLRRLASNERGIVVVTHKMDEVAAHADVVTVMRKGALVSTRTIDRGGDVRAQVDEVVAAIMGEGRAAETETSEGRSQVGDDTVLSIKDVRLDQGLNGLSLELKSGEIVGIAGIEGNGQRELVAALAGDQAVASGHIRGSAVRDLRERVPRDSRGLEGRIAFIREDRQLEGLVLDASIRENIMLGELGRFAGPAGLLDLPALEREARARLERSGAPRDLDRTARTLSGGNQQKIVVARALAREARVVVAAQPTRGIDLAAARDIHAELRRAARGGAGVLVISADLDELRSLASRILVIARGRIVAEFPPSASDEELGRSMLGIEEEARS